MSDWLEACSLEHTERKRRIFQNKMGVVMTAQAK